MDLASPATATPGLLPAVAAPPDDPAAAACRQLPFPRFAAASSPRWSSAPPATGRVVVTSSSSMAAASEAAADEERMDLLWEDFNEELAVRGARGGSWRRAEQDGRRLVEEGEAPAPWSSESSDAESEPAGRGCAPVMRPSARAGHCRRRAGTWVLLMRIFRRLFVVEKTIATQRQRAAATAR